MRTVQLHGLNRQYVALVDDEDYDRVSVHKWFAYRARGLMYAIRQTGSTKTKTKKVYYLHREVMRAEKGQQVDHRDGDGLNCQKSNLRFSTQGQNMANRRRRSALKSRYRGVNKQTTSPTYLSRITAHGQLHYLGSFSSEEEAARAYDKAARRLHGEFARLNFPLEG